MALANCRPRLARVAARARGMASFYDKTVALWGGKEAPLVRLDDLFPPAQPVTEATMLSNARFVRNTVAIRLARRIQKMQALPFIIGMNPHINSLHDLYHDALARLIATPEPTTHADERKMTLELFPSLLDATAVVVPTLAQAARGLSDIMPPDELADFVDSILSGRILRRTLVEHHMLLNDAFNAGEQQQQQQVVAAAAAASGGASSDGAEDAAALGGSGPHVYGRGVINTACDLEAVVHRSFAVASDVVASAHGWPRHSFTLDIEKKPKRPVCYIDSHLEHVLVEIFKNSCAAVVDSAAGAGGRSDTDAMASTTTLHVAIYHADDDVTIKIRDHGGGIPGDTLGSVFRYGFTTKSTDVEGGESSDVNDAGGGHGGGTGDASAASGSSSGPLPQHRPVLAEGFGLPMARLYLSFFGGDINLQSITGHSTDAYIHLRELKAHGFMQQE